MASFPLTASVGWSTKTEATRAGKEAAGLALGRLPSSTPKLALVFGSSWFDQPSLLHGIQSILGDVPMVGGSTAGEIVSQGPMSHSCALMLLASEKLTCSVGVGESAEAKPREAGHHAAYAAAQGLAGQPRAGFLLFGDGLVSSYADIIRGLQEALGTSSLIVGGMAGDDLRFLRTAQYANGRVISGGVVGALFGGPVAIGVGLEHGFAPISKPRRITRAQGNVLFELDRLPAASVYEEYFGADVFQRMREERMTRQAIAFPLGMQYGASPQWLLRNVVAFQPDGSLTCNAELLEGTWLQLMMGSRQSAIDAAHQAALQAVTSLNRVGCVVVFDSAARRILLGAQHAAMEIERIRDAIGPSTPLIGCYTYGEHMALNTGTITERTTIHTGSVLVMALGAA